MKGKCFDVQGTCEIVRISLGAEALTTLLLQKEVEGNMQAVKILRA